MTDNLEPVVKLKRPIPLPFSPFPGDWVLLEVLHSADGEWEEVDGTVVDVDVHQGPEIHVTVRYGEPPREAKVIAWLGDAFPEATEPDLG